jgi:acyl-CoA thioester hydrolase
MKFKMVSEIKVEVRYAETDKMGITHHSVYPIWYEAARTELIKKIGITYSEMERKGIMLPLAELNCKYIIPSTYEDKLTIKVWVSKITPARIVFNYETYKEEISKAIATGETIHAWADSKTLKPMNLKKNFPEYYEKIEKLVEE